MNRNDTVIQLVSVADLKGAPYNPARRDRSVNDLIAAIKLSHYIRPIDITEDLTIIDGHRRVAAAKSLGIERLQAIVHSAEHAGILYAALNSAVMRPSGNDNLTVYMSQPDAVSPAARRGMARMEDVLGRELMQRLVDHGGSTATYRQAVRVADYCDVKNDRDWLRAIVKWMLETRQTYQVRRAIEDGIDAKSLMRAIETGHPIRRGWAVEA